MNHKHIPRPAKRKTTRLHSLGGPNTLTISNVAAGVDNGTVAHLAIGPHLHRVQPFVHLTVADAKAAIAALQAIVADATNTDDHAGR